MSPQIVKVFKNPLAFAAATLIIHISAAGAAEPTGDIQQQVRDVLTGTTTAHSAPQSGSREGDGASAAVDFQDSVRQLLLGATASPAREAEAVKEAELAGTPRKTETQQGPLAHNDIQAAMRNLLRGQPHASDAS
jgi:hypothetical protein